MHLPRSPFRASRIRAPFLLFALLAITGLPARLRAQSGTEIVRGRVLTDKKEPIADAQVSVIGLATQITQTTHTNKTGTFTILFQNAEGDYIVTIRKIGFSPVRLRMTRTGVSSIIGADITLKAAAFELDTMVVTANRNLPPGGDRASIGGLEQNILAGALFSLDPSDLLSLAAAVPGVLALGDSGYSVLGAGADQNATSLDGMRFGGGNIPRDAISTARVVTTSADPARGGFAGGLTSTTLRGGTDVFAANIRGTLSDKSLSWRDPLWPNPVPRVGGLSGSVSGPIIKRKLNFFAAWDANDNRAEAFTLLAPDGGLLNQYGMTLDTVAAVTEALRGLGTPLTTSAIPRNRTSQRASASMTFDYKPTATTSLRLSYAANWYRSGGQGLSLQSFPSVSNRNEQNFNWLALKLSSYFHGLLSETNLAANLGSYSSGPYLDLPTGSVRVGTVFEEGRTGLGTLRFGGGGGVSRSTQRSLDLSQEFSWLTKDSKHRLKFGGNVAPNWNRNFSAGSQFGSYVYQSLADLQANRPTSYSRTLSSFEREARGTYASAWVGDEWRVSPALQFQYGLRLDGSHSGTRPSYNPVVDSVFGIRTDRVPGSVGLAPRVGFSWVSKARRIQGQGVGGGGGGPMGMQLPPGVSFSSLPPEIQQALMGGVRGSSAPGYTISGSLGAYRGTVDAGRIASLVDATGLPATRRSLSCAGAAAPIPDWSAIGGMAPDACLDGTAPGTFSVSQPTVTVFDPAYQAPVSWRGSLGIDGIRVFGWSLGLTGSYSLGVNNESGIDLNLKRSGGFTLDNEGGRPVYANPADIVPGTGLIAPGSTRISQDFGRVTNSISDLSNKAALFNVTLAPPKPILKNKVSLNLSYSYNWNTREQRGFGGGGGFFGEGAFEVISLGGFSSFSGFGGGGSTTAGDPATKEWVRGSQPTHTISMTTNARLWWFNLAIRTNLFSGIPFTPTVVGDVNGDGMSNDRAFVPSLTGGDPALAAQLTDLLASSSGSARRCLEAQVGRIAGANSCRTQWQSRLDLSLNFQPPQNFGFGDRLRLTTTMQNASGAMVRLLGLEDTPLGRSAATTTPDSRLLYITGFDPATRRYSYRVNQLFGEPLDYGTARRRFPPFQLQVGLEYKMGGPPTSPMARSLGLLPASKEPALTEAQVRLKVAAMSRNPIRPILALKDSLVLTPAQRDSLEAIDARYQAAADSLLEPLVDFVLDKGRKLNDTDLNKRLAKIQPTITKMMLEARTKALGLLAPEQRTKLPVSAGGTGGPAATPGGGAAPRPAGASGGGEEIRIIRPGPA